MSLGSCSEKNRLNNLAKISNTYLKKVKYCNKDSFLKNSVPQYLLELVLDYGEHDINNPQPDDPGLWNYRLDPFSDYHAGFEIRTYRLCRRLLCFIIFRNLAKPLALLNPQNLTTIWRDFHFSDFGNPKRFYPEIRWLLHCQGYATIRVHIPAPGMG